MRKLCIAVTFTAVAPRRAWNEGTCGATSWAPAKNDCVCDAKGSIKLNDDYFLSWRQAMAKCSEACSRCERCRYISVSLYESCPAIDKLPSKRLNSRIVYKRSFTKLRHRCPVIFFEDRTSCNRQ